MQSIHTCNSLSKCIADTANYVLNSKGQNEHGSPNRWQHCILEPGEDFAVLPQGKTVFGAELQNLPTQRRQKFHFYQKREKAYTLIRQLYLQEVLKGVFSTKL